MGLDAAVYVAEWAVTPDPRFLSGGPYDLTLLEAMKVCRAWRGVGRSVVAGQVTHLQAGEQEKVVSEAMNGGDEQPRHSWTAVAVGDGELRSTAATNRSRCSAAVEHEMRDEQEE